MTNKTLLKDLNLKQAFQPTPDYTNQSLHIALLNCENKQKAVLKKPSKRSKKK